MKYENVIINSEGKRSAGILMHVSSLPGKYGIGTLGQEAYRFVDFLKSAGVHYWQVLPLVQTGFGDSPYQSVCCTSGNPYFIDPDSLAAEGLLTKAELKEAVLPQGEVDYAAVYNTRYPVLRKAFARFDREDKDFKAFVREGKFRSYAEYMTVKQAFSNRCFVEWDREFRLNDREMVEAFIRENYDEYLFWNWLQFEFRRQWFALKKYANKSGVYIIGDIPLYVAYDSSDVWANPELFQLDENRAMKEVAGVPPDYFSEDGQLWGNPLYDWTEQEKDGYAWWISRLRDALEIFDVIRLDHFRGLDRYYAIPNGRKDARVGEWRDGPKAELFKLAKERLGEMNVIAEDLGIMDDGVIKLLEDTGYPGMKILLFAFEGGDNAYLPKHIGHNSVCYTGTHDNDTAVGYFNRLSGEMLRLVRKNVKDTLKEENLALPVGSKKNLAEALVHLCFASKACMAIIPIQDLLFLDNRARMNVPSTGDTNWRFRLKKNLTETEANYLKALLKKYKRK